MCRAFCKARGQRNKKPSRGQVFKRTTMNKNVRGWRTRSKGEQDKYKIKTWNKMAINQKDEKDDDHFHFTTKTAIKTTPRLHNTPQ
jgi:hypothetical protein